MNLTDFQLDIGNNVKKFVEGKYLSAKNVGDNRGKTVTIDAAFQDVSMRKRKLY